MYTLKQIAEITGSKLAGSADHAVNYFLTDSRNLQTAADSLFIALKTPRNDGHNYIEELIKKGVRSFLVQDDHKIAPNAATDITYIVSTDPLRALQVLAAYHRSRFSIPVIGITGSNGKTVVKEWLYQLLKDRFTICRSPKSYNSQIGVPLSVLNLNDTHTLGIFEAGISQPGEMELLASIIKPTIGVLTSIGSAHDEGFESRSQKIAEKTKLFVQSQKLVISGLPREQAPAGLPATTLFVSELNGADLQISFKNDTLHLKGAGKDYTFKIPFTDEASVYNAATCVGVLLQLGLREQEVARQLPLLQPVALRLEIRNGIHNSLIINDYYNSDLDSIKIALNYLQQQNRRAKKIVVISDIEQSGIPANALYQQLATLLSLQQIDLLVGIGKEISAHKPLFKAGSLFYNDTNSFIQQFRSVDYRFADAGILLKGARSFGFESISRLLQAKSHDTVFEINLNKLINNVNYYRSLTGPDVNIMGMVKAMGYGSGSSEVAKTLQHIGVNYLAVAYADEGVELRQSQVGLPVMVMSPEEAAFEDIINYHLEPELYNFKVLRGFSHKLDTMGISEAFPVHIKIDTGMHRLGFEERELNALVEELKRTPNLKVRSVFSHLAGSDNAQLDDFTREQLRIFEKAFTLIEKALGYKVLKHICNSAGISRFKEAHYDMVRLGIGMYGIGADAAEQQKLENAGALKTRISQIKQVKPGQTVGYNRNGKIDRDTTIATIPIGYADGFSRLLGNGRHGAYVNGSFCKTVGNICMDMCMIDITGVSCREGDEVVLFETTEQIMQMAAALQSIPYEVLTNVSARVKRVYVQE